LKFSSTALALILAFAVSESLGGTAAKDMATAAQSEDDQAKWEYSISTATYLALDSQDYVNPIITADRDWLHLEGRYNYEGLKTGSLWLGYNFSFGEKLLLEVTPMLGGVFGNTTGIAPGYTIAISYKAIEFFTQGEYLFDAGTHSNNFFYTWSELSCSPLSWFRVGIVVDRTKALGADIDIRRGPLLGLRYRKIDFTTYWLSPGEKDATFIFAVSMKF
jgi:hypothetical protein